MSRAPDTIVLIHGLWVTPRSWEGWIDRFESRGYRVLAPAYPGLDVEVEALRDDPSPIEALTVSGTVEHFEGLLSELESPPILIGHSFGGLIVQILLDRGYGAVGIAINSVPPEGIRRVPLSQIKAAFPVLGNPANRHRAVPFTPEEFHYAFANTLDREESDALHARYHVPGSSRVLREGAFANLHRHPATEVDFERPERAPLLLIGFGEDHIVPAKVARHNAEKYKSGRVEFAEFADRPHFPGAPGWEEVADHALEWATASAAAASATAA